MLRFGTPFRTLSDLGQLNLAETLSLHHKYLESIALYQAALESLRGQLGEEHPKTKATTSAYLSVLSEHRQIKTAGRVWWKQAMLNGVMNQMPLLFMFAFDFAKALGAVFFLILVIDISFVRSPGIPFSGTVWCLHLPRVLVLGPDRSENQLGSALADRSRTLCNDGNHLRLAHPCKVQLRCQGQGQVKTLGPQRHVLPPSSHCHRCFKHSIWPSRVQLSQHLPARDGVSVVAP